MDFSVIPLNKDARKIDLVIFINNSVVSQLDLMFDFGIIGINFHLTRDSGRGHRKLPVASWRRWIHGGQIGWSKAGGGVDR